MKFLNFITFLFSIYQTSFNLVKGQATDNRKSDCTKLYNYLYGDSKNYANKCCSEYGIKCDNEGYITYVN